MSTKCKNIVKWQYKISEQVPDDGNTRYGVLSFIYPVEISRETEHYVFFDAVDWRGPEYGNASKKEKKKACGREYFDTWEEAYRALGRAMKKRVAISS